MESTPAVELMDELGRRLDEPLVRGQAANGFDRTVLDTILRLAGVDTLVIVGIATDVAVESTARAASDLGYRTIVVSDACTADSDESHARSLDVLQKWFAETPTTTRSSAPWEMRGTSLKQGEHPCSDNGSLLTLVESAVIIGVTPS
jgi:nicotinamidase-related amidase